MKSRLAILSKALLMAAVLAFPCPVVFAGTAPDIVWTGTLHTNWVYALAFSQDSSLLASGSEDGTVRLWEATDGAVDGTAMNAGGPVRNLWFRADGTLLSWARTGVLRQWRLADQTAVQSWAYPASFAEFSAAGDLFASGSYVTQNGGLSVWHLGSVGAVHIQEYGDYPSFSPDGSELAVAYFFKERYVVELYRTSDWSLRLTLENHLDGVSTSDSALYSPDGSLLLVRGWAVYASELWRMPGGEYYGSIADAANNNYPRVKLFTPDGKLIVTVNHDLMRIWQVRPGESYEPAFVYDQGFGGAVSMVVAPNGKLVALGLADGKVMVLRMPILMQNPRREGNGLRLEWLGASGPYQLQRRETLAAGDWQNVGSPMNDSSATVDLSGSQAFFRVLGLP